MLRSLALVIVVCLAAAIADDAGYIGFSEDSRFWLTLTTWIAEALFILTLFWRLGDLIWRKIGESVEARDRRLAQMIAEETVARQEKPAV